jgi:hypothetical protein
MTDYIYDGTHGLVIDVECVDIEDLTAATVHKLYVRPPGVAPDDEEEWAATVESPNILRHVVDAAEPLEAGRYRMQPYVETGDFAGRLQPVEIVIKKHWRT